MNRLIMIFFVFFATNNTFAKSASCEEKLYTCLGTEDGSKAVFIDIPGTSPSMAKKAIRNVHRGKKVDPLSCSVSTYQNTKTYADCMSALYYTGFAIPICQRKFNAAPKQNNVPTSDN